MVKRKKVLKQLKDLTDQLVYKLANDDEYTDVEVNDIIATALDAPNNK